MFPSRFCKIGKDPMGSEDKGNIKQVPNLPGYEMTIWQLPSMLLVVISSVSPHPHHLFEYDELSQYVDSHQEEYVQASSNCKLWIPGVHNHSNQIKSNCISRISSKITIASLYAGGYWYRVIVRGHRLVEVKCRVIKVTRHLYGRGASDNKAPVLAWIHTVEAYQALSIDLPVNVKFIIEGMEETGSNGLDAMIVAQKDTFFSDVDYIIISDCGWLSRRPALTYGTRGNCYFFAEVEGPKQDLHSGVYGGTVIEPMTDLIGILDTLISPSGKILIPGIREAVAPLSDEEWKMYQDIEFDIESFKSKIGVSQLMYSNKVDLLAHRWRYPTVTIHGIEGAFSGPGSKTVIPAKVIAKFSIRQVPNMDPAVVKKQVTDYLYSVFAKRKSPNKLKVTMIIGAKPWLADTKHPLYEAGKAAVKRVFDVEPDLIREGGTIPIAKTFEDVTGKSIIMMPIGGFDDGLHSQNEKMSRYNYIEGTKLFIAYLHEVAHLKKD
ncbi:unnamed protein product [Oncorhynchus mykiss]|uniref:Peptidase M20 dimerisation domain-containing protein n=1 Tax=Oncorhynchus mykiss TaxID=8022 RepID=A0A060X9B9_ONCMY|nr:unnamed protein product [Oncorhynchus mykiss]